MVSHNYDFIILLLYVSAFHKGRNT